MGVVPIVDIELHVSIHFAMPKSACSMGEDHVSDHFTVSR